MGNNEYSPSVIEVPELKAYSFRVLRPLTPWSPQENHALQCIAGSSAFSVQFYTKWAALNEFVQL